MPANTGKEQSPKAGLAEGATDDVDDYVDFAALLCARSSDLMGIWLDNADQAHVEVEFHRECIDQWRKTLGQMKRELKREATVDTSSEPKVVDLSDAADFSDYREINLEMARRHVREGEARVTRQRKIIAGMPPTDELSRTARRVLVEFERTLRDHKAHLARLEGRGTA